MKCPKCGIGPNAPTQIHRAGVCGACEREQEENNGQILD